jgi:hypothetical protein
MQSPVWSIVSDLSAIHICAAGRSGSHLAAGIVAWTVEESLRMSLDATKIGQVVAEQMEALEARFGEDCQIGDVCTIVEVLGPNGSSVAVRSGPDVRPHGLIGLLRLAERVALADVHGESPDEDG